jgi:hypothetical protein
MGILEDDLNALEACGSVVEICEVFSAQSLRITDSSSFGFMDRVPSVGGTIRS